MCMCILGWGHPQYTTWGKPIRKHPGYIMLVGLPVTRWWSLSKHLSTWLFFALPYMYMRSRYRNDVFFTINSALIMSGGRILHGSRACDGVRTESECCRIPTRVLQISNPMDFQTRFRQTRIQLLFSWKASQSAICHATVNRHWIAIYSCLYRLNTGSDQKFSSDLVFST